MEKIISTIKAAAEQALSTYALIAAAQPGAFPYAGPPGTFLHGRAADANHEANQCPLPLVLLFDPATSQATTSGKTEQATITLYFADEKPGQGDDEAAEAAAVNRMDQLKRRFLSALDSSPVVQIEQVQATPFHDNYAARLTGVGVRFTLTVPAGSLAAACV